MGTLYYVRSYLCFLLLCAQLVWTAPQAGQAHEPNDCLIQAYRLQHELPRGTWSRLLAVRYFGRPLGHVYLIWRLAPGRYIRQDAESGAREIHPRSLCAQDVVLVADPLAVAGDYVADEPAAALTARPRP